MSARVRSRSRGKRDGKKPSKLDEPGVAKQPGKKTVQKEEPPTEDLDIEPGQEREEGACGVQELELKAESQEKGLEKTGGELGDGPDVKGKTPPNVTLAKIQEAGDGQS
ncbi:P antigen family member 4 [Leptonychotes weddellii]|uniref:P antigen family member 4 n=1 Tax=Leptonychotes weddellii TaxID=9713 RepID=A0A7F8RMH8_LEPWE|nr:P antigen family member 4 [Leptonychotes weddellii]XP_030894649.1 P antigen family member 4 [Leptonychotes weddellii]XP_030894650.1 P antigen family member 4 [Leptonychotes weddellii]XP_030894651.1 P antigen family member 4 [Leptonychotes weddellii]XP_030894652.1 P antigen family member 4 [Leptonychotes weddellii]